MTDDLSPDLEQFRQQWRAEVSSKKKSASTLSHQAAAGPSRIAPRRPSNVPKTKPGKIVNDIEESSSEDEKKPRAGRRASVLSADGQHAGAPPAVKEPATALEFYEKAVTREAEGSLGDSLKLYRKAFRMDDNVDKLYRNKHHPPTSFKPKPKPTPSVTPASKPTTAKPPKDKSSITNTAHHSLDGPPPAQAAATEPTPAPVLPTADLITSFATLSLSRAEPPIEGAPPPPCPLADLPEELLTMILITTALIDFPSFMRLAQVCKRLAYLVFTEQQIWRHLCLGWEYGFPAMHYAWTMTVEGDPLPISIDDEGVSLALISPVPQPLSNDPLPVAIPTPLPPLMPSYKLSKTYPTYSHMFRHRPRIRFNGIYISTVNYIRPGQAAPSSSTWGAPVHIVTYYRYLRFFRDGAVLSLLTTDEPSQVVHELRPELLHKRPPANSIVALVLRGRWKLGGEPEFSRLPNGNWTDNTTHPSSSEGEAEIDESALTVETEGCKDTYVYRMEFMLKGQERGRPRLVWKDFWNWNREQDEWQEFGLRNDRAFVFSRVRGYGLGA